MNVLKPSPANSSPLTPLSFLERAATVYGDCPSLVYNTTTYTWSQTHRRCLQVASSLSSIGINPLDVVSVLAPNIPAMYELHFAVPMAGAVFNTINTRLDARTVHVILSHSESKLVFVDHQFSSLIQEALTLFPRNTKPPILVLITDDEDAISFSSPAVDFLDTYENMVMNGDPEFEWVRPESEWDPIVLNYTSGTTAAPKGVVHCHRGIFITTADSLIDWDVPKRPVYLWTLPMFHANGWSFTWGMAAVGGTNICLRKFHVATIYSLIKKHGVTHMCSAPVVLNMLSKSPDTEPLLNPVNILVAGAPPPPTVISAAESLGFTVSHGYGLTEAAGVIVSCAWKTQWNSLPMAERAKLKARQGVRTNGVAKLEVVDPESGASVKHDGLSIGEIVVKCRSLMLGYLKDQEATAKCTNIEGWFYTGDLAVVHIDGYLEIKDRSKDVIISGGENLSSAEVEAVLYTNPVVKEAAVVARPDELWGETACAFVSLRREVDRKPTEREMIEFCRERMPHFMVPKRIVFEEEIPKTATGKFQKSVLREIAKALE